jgi:hypothetical protein
VAFGAFVLGQKYTARHQETSVASGSVPSRETTPVAPDHPSTPLVADTSIAHKTPEAVPPKAEDSTFEAVQQSPRVTPMPVAKSDPSPRSPVVASEPAAATAPVTPRATVTQPGSGSLKSFTVASAQAESMIHLQPKLLRVAAKPVPREFAGQVLAAPIQEKPKTAVKNPVFRKPAPQPPLEIHSWKAEIASCPWDTSRRLMRFVAQIPVDQDGIETNARDYQISVKFDPAQVQAWRLVMEKHMPPTNGGQLATRFAWYEIVPARNFAPKTDKPTALGSLDIIQPRGASHDGPPLKLLDRGLEWNETREDFIFETAMVGFNLLLQGRENIGSLDHKLVLKLASQSSDDDPKGERGKFITAVKQAQRAAGL